MDHSSVLSPSELYLNSAFQRLNFLYFHFEIITFILGRLHCSKLLYSQQKMRYICLPQFMLTHNSSFTLRWIFLIKISGMPPPFIRTFYNSAQTKHPHFVCHSSSSSHHLWFLACSLSFISSSSPGVTFPISPAFQICHSSSCHLSFTFFMKFISTL